MKILKAHLVICILLLAASCRKEKSESCIDKDLLDKAPLVLCSDEYDPVCGCDGVTYDNECVAKFQNGVRMYTPGACGCEYPYTGKVVDFTGLDGCGKLIELPDGSKLEVAQLPSGFSLMTGQKVEFDYMERTDLASICMVGKIVEISCIRAISCMPIYSRSMLDSVTNYQDPIIINSASISNDCLYINYSYGGGCVPNHQVRLAEITPWCGTPPLPPTQLVLEHESFGDLCQALITYTESYDLTNLQAYGQKSIEFFLSNPQGSYNQKFVYNY